MGTFYYFFATTVSLLIFALQLLMMIRVILSWIFPNSYGSPFSNVIYGITEVVIAPMRAFCAKSSTLSSLPLDMPFFFTYIALSIIDLLL